MYAILKRFWLGNANKLKLTDWGAASDAFGPSKEDERSSALALRARQGDYDDGGSARSIP
jgi:hypothetical protein